MNVLAVVPGEAQAAALEERFQKRLGDALTFRQSSSGKRALELLQTLPTDLLICARETDDIAGLEVLKAVRKEHDTAVILLDRNILSHFSPGPFDAILDAQAHPADVLETAFSLLVSSGRFEDARRPQDTFSKGRGRDAKVSGTLEVVSLFDLVLLLTQKERTGKLYLLLGQVEAMFVFQGGGLVHAEYSELTGEAAVMKIFWKAELRPDAEFFFEPSPHKLPPGGVTVHSSVQEILLKVAVGLDRQRGPTAGQ